MAPPDPNSVAPCAPPSGPLRPASGGGLRPALTAAARDAIRNRGRDGETVPQSNRETGEQKQATKRKKLTTEKPLDLESPIQGRNSLRIPPNRNDGMGSAGRRNTLRYCALRF